MPEESKLAEKLENQQKFTEEELTEIKGIQQEYIKIQTQFGRIRIAKIRLEEQNEALSTSTMNTEKSFKELQVKERKFLEEITKKYGEGSVDPTSGVFTKNISE